MDSVVVVRQIVGLKAQIVCQHLLHFTSTPAGCIVNGTDMGLKTSAGSSCERGEACPER